MNILFITIKVNCCEFVKNHTNKILMCGANSSSNENNVSDNYKHKQKINNKTGEKKNTRFYWCDF